MSDRCSAQHGASLSSKEICLINVQQPLAMAFWEHHAEMTYCLLLLIHLQWLCDPSHPVHPVS